MKYYLPLLLLLAGCAPGKHSNIETGTMLPNVPVIQTNTGVGWQFLTAQSLTVASVQTPPMPSEVTTNIQQSSAADVLAAPLPGHQVTTLSWTIDTNHTCAWWTIQGSDDGAMWTNEYSIMTAEQMPTNNQLTFTNSNPRHYWRYVIHN